jgi:hypothetical protein
MIGSNKQMVNVALLREDVNRIRELKKPVSEFCSDAVHERLRIIEMAKENTVEDWMYADSEEVSIIDPEPTSPNWSKLFAKV